MALTDKLTAIGSAIRNKTGSTDLLTLDEMPTAISNIQTGSGGGSVTDFIPESAFVFDSPMDYRFYGGNWDWIIKQYGDRITICDEGIQSWKYTFSHSNLENIPFDIKLSETSTGYIDYLFAYSGIREIPKITGKVYTFNRMISDCYYLQSIPYDLFEHITFSSSKNFSFFFNNCYSLRKIPQTVINRIRQTETSPYSLLYYNGFNNCYSLDEITNIPVFTQNITSNSFISTFYGCSRLKNLTFESQDDGTPVVAQWKSQTIDLSSYVGYVSNSSSILNYNSGITSDKHVENDATYQALKDDPDWYSIYFAYSRYNHDSAVVTINSLPDTSAYLAEKGGTNTIKFKGASGSSTDGGAINTLTEEEIAVATAKGWTVTLV